MSKAAKTNEIYTASLIDKFLLWLKKTTFNTFVETNEKWFTKIGLSLMYFIAAMSLLTSIVLLIKYNALSSGNVFMIGICGLIVTLVLQYVAAKTLPCLNLLISNTPVKLSSSAILDITALTAGILGIMSLLGGLIISINLDNVQIIIAALAFFVLCTYWAAMALKPDTLNIEIVKNTSAGEELIGLLTFFAKGSLKIIPLIFCGCMIFSAYEITAMIFHKFIYIDEIKRDACLTAYSLSGALLPLFGYLSFIAYYFTIDIARAILSIPEKLDKK